ncbi:MAG: MarR family winged helix-turn-helix transcriptional regulator [Ectothiorhodospiraceae bacterium]
MTDASTRVTADLLLHLAYRATGAGHQPSLSSAQWSALRFFARANRLSRTPSAFARFHGTTRGTASQTVKALVRMGYLERRPGERDRRRSELHLTAAGNAALENDPAEALVQAIGSLPVSQRQGLETAIRQLNGILDAADDGTFGSCGECCYLEDAGCGEAACALTGETLDAGDKERLCCAFVAAPDSADAPESSEPAGCTQLPQGQ